MRAARVVVMAPALDQHLYFPERIEDFLHFLEPLLTAEALRIATDRLLATGVCAALAERGLGARGRN